MTDNINFETVDYFTDESLVPDPYPYFDHLRSKCPVAPATPFGVLAVTGYAAFAADPVPESTASGPVTLVSTKPRCSSCQINRPATHSCYVLAWSENGPEWTSSDSHLSIRSYQG